MLNKLNPLLLTTGLILIPSLLFGWTEPTEDVYTKRRHDMVDRQIRQRGVNDQRVLAAMGKVKRHLFIPQELCDMAYEDTPLPIRYDQTISQPYIVAYMTEALKLQPGDRVLEVGTGSGYQTAILAEIAKDVYSIERLASLGEPASKRLEELGYKNTHVKIGDGYKGWTENAPYDAIIVTTAPLNIPPDLVSQLKPGGRMVVPVGSVFQDLILVTKAQDGFQKKSLIPVRFVPMITPHENRQKPDDGKRHGGIFK